VTTNFLIVSFSFCYLVLVNGSILAEHTVVCLEQKRHYRQALRSCEGMKGLKPDELGGGSAGEAFEGAGEVGLVGIAGEVYGVADGDALLQ
jgi:hypothetical protein